MQKEQLKRVAVTLGTILLLIALTGYTLLQCGVFGSAGRLTLLPASEITVDHILSAKGYVFRSETVLPADAATVADALVKDGDKVAAGTALTDVYTASSAENASEIRRRIAEIDREISFLTLCGSVDGLKLSDADSLWAEMYEAYRRAVAGSERGDGIHAALAAEQMLVAMSRYEILIGNSEGTAGAISALLEERDRLLRLPKQTVYASGSGYYFSPSATDGYESVFRSDLLETLSGDSLSELLAYVPSGIPDNAGKLLTDYRWYLAVPVTEQQETLIEDDRYDVTVTTDDGDTRTLPMSVEDRKPVSDGGYVLVLCCTRMPDGFSLSRTVGVSLTTETISGYRVPEEALTVVDGYDGVYILEDSAASFRRVSVLARYPGYVVIDTKDSAKEEKYPYLKRNDRMILDGKDLYDGKLYH